MNTVEDFCEDQPAPKTRPLLWAGLALVVLLLLYALGGYRVRQQELHARQVLWQDRVAIAPASRFEATTWVAEHVITAKCYQKNAHFVWWHDRVGYRHMLKDAEQVCLREALNQMAMDPSTSITQHVIVGFLDK